ncbi:MAG: kelch repeat-containing protein [Chloroflexaceae bacterium]
MSTDETTRLSDREQEILIHVAHSATNQQIAHDLGISIHTVKVHLRNIFGKIGVSSRTEAALYALRQGLVQFDESRIDAVSPEDDDGAALSEPAGTGLKPEEMLAIPANEPGPSAVPVSSPTDAATAQPAPPQRQSHPVIIGLVILCVLLAAGLIYVLLTQLPAESTAADLPPAEEPEPSPVAAPATTAKQTRTPMLQPLKHFAVAVYGLDERIYIIGGTAGSEVSDTVMRYDPQTDLWVELSTKPTPASHIHAATLRGKIYIPGGEGANGTVFDTFEAFDPRTQQWETLPDLPAPRSRYALATAEGRLYLFGGWDGTTFRDETFIYDPSLDEWNTGPSLSAPRQNAGAEAIKGQIFVVGGEDASGPLRIVERYDPTRNTRGAWTPAAPLPVAVAEPAVVPLIDNLLMFEPDDDDLFSYMPENDAWMQRTFPVDIDVSSRAIVLDTRLYLFGEPEGDTPGTLTLYEADLDVYRTFIPSVPRP